MTALTLLAFDFGTKHMGVAVGQQLTQTATPLKAIPMKEGIPDWETLDALRQEWRAHAFVVGLPLNMDGTEQNVTQGARAFALALEDRFGLPVYTVDERLTTKAVKEKIFEEGGFKALKKADLDSLAAQLILQQWLQANRNPSNE